MGKDKPFDRSMFVLGGSVKTAGSSGTLAKGQLAVVDRSVTNSQGLQIVSNFLGKDKNKQDLSIRLGVAKRKNSRSRSFTPESTMNFSINEVERLFVSAPKRTEAIPDELIIGYNGIDPATSFNFSNGDAPFNLTLALQGGFIDWLGAGNDTEYVHITYDFPQRSLIGCDEVEPCTPIDCRAVTTDIVERLRERQLGGGRRLDEVVTITPVFGGCQEPTIGEEEFVYWTLEVCDNGDDNALAMIAAQYEVPVVFVSRTGATSTYQIMLPEGEAPDDYVWTPPLKLKGCADCPAGYTAEVGGYVYSVSLEDDGTDQSAALAAFPSLVTGSAALKGKFGGKGVYTLLTSVVPTQAAIDAWVAGAAIRTTSTIALMGLAADICAGGTDLEYAWVEGETCQATTEDWEITLPDDECGNSRLAELQAAYPDYTVVIDNTGNSTRNLTLTGTSGTANVSVGGTNYLATFATNLDTTGANFITAHGATILTAKGVTVADLGSGVLRFTGPTATINAITITNATTNLAGTLAASALVLVTGACQTRYVATVITNFVCDECDPIFRDYYTSEQPEDYMDNQWSRSVVVVSDTSCLCGIRIKGNIFTVHPPKSMIGFMDYKETGTQIQASAGYLDSISEGIGNFLPENLSAITWLSKWTPRTHVVGHLLNLEKESHAYFRDVDYRMDELGRILTGEDTNAIDFDAQYIQYSLTVHTKNYSQSFANVQANPITYHFFVGYGRHQALENVLNSLATAAGKDAVQATALP